MSVIIKNSKLVDMFLEFKLKNQDKYLKEEWEYIENNFFARINDVAASDLLMQVYAELGLRNNATLFYDRHLKLIKDIYSIDGNILDVASGLLPSFANKMACEQLKIGKGTITVYDPLLRFLSPKYQNMILKKEFFTSNLDVTKYDLLVGILPCEATNAIIESAVTSHKDFYVAMCGCVHSFYSSSSYLYQQSIIMYAESLLKKYSDKKLEITNFDDYPINFPILYTKKREYHK